MGIIPNNSRILAGISVARKFYALLSNEGGFDELNEFRSLELEFAEKLILGEHAELDQVVEVANLLDLVSRQMRKRGLSILARQVEQAVNQVSQFCEAQKAGQANAA